VIPLSGEARLTAAPECSELASAVRLMQGASPRSFAGDCASVVLVPSDSERTQETDVSPALVNVKEVVMKIAVIGGTGLIGSRLATNLRAHGHEAVAASPKSGVNTITGDGLADALKDASVVIDVTNSASWDDTEVLKFFETSTRNLLAYEAAEGIGHHVALAVVGTERLLESGFFRAKLAQENLIKASKNFYTIVRATQFFEFVKHIVDYSTEGNIVRMPAALIQPMAADDVAGAVAMIATNPPVNGTVEIGGPEQFPLDELARRFLAARRDQRQVISDTHGRYYGIQVSERALVPDNHAQLSETRFETWLAESASQIASASPQPASVGR
jgi:uncharacterized protein YbjT (DUF2867 family)